MTSNNNLPYRVRAIRQFRKSRSGVCVFDETEELINYWFRLPKIGLLSNKADIHPRDIIALLPRIVILDMGENAGCRVRLTGTWIAGRWGFDPTHADFFDFVAPQNHSAVTTHLAALHKQPCGVILQGDEFYTSGRKICCETVLFPVYTDNAEVKTVIGLMTPETDAVETEGDILASAFYTLHGVRYINIGAGVPG